MSDLAIRERYLPIMIEKAEKIQAETEYERSNLRRFSNEAGHILETFEESPWPPETHQRLTSYYTYVAARYASDEVTSRRMLRSMNLPDSEDAPMERNLIQDVDRLLRLINDHKEA